MTYTERLILALAIVFAVCFAIGYLATRFVGPRSSAETKKFRGELFDAMYAAQAETFARAKQLFASVVDRLTKENESRDDRQVELIKLAVHHLPEFVALAEANGLTHDDAVLASVGACSVRTELAIALWESML